MAIDAVAARLMGFDPMTIRYIRLAHEAGLGSGDVREIELVGDKTAAAENWHFEGPFRRMTFASRMQHQIYWGPLKRPIEWSLKTVLAPWAYLASVLYHDSFWYPLFARRQMRACLESDWGRLFANWESLAPDRQGFPSVGEAPAVIRRTGFRAFARSLPILATTIREAPELAARRRRVHAEPPPAERAHRGGAGRSARFLEGWDGFPLESTPYELTGRVRACALCAEPHGAPPRRRRPHCALQLALRPTSPGGVSAPDRGHRSRPLDRRGDRRRSSTR